MLSQLRILAMNVPISNFLGRLLVRFRLKVETEPALYISGVKFKLLFLVNQL
jgi:hypothetical protein